MDFDFTVDLSALIQGGILAILVWHHKRVEKSVDGVNRLVTLTEIHHWRLSDLEKIVKPEGQKK